MNSRLPQLLRLVPTLTTAVILLVIFAQVPAFRRPEYWMTLSQTYFATAALALALVPIMLTGGIDLSVGSTTVLSTVVIGMLWRDVGLPIEVALLGGVLAGLFAGLANGFLIHLGTWPLVATLATRELFRGLAMTISADNPVTRFPEGFDAWWRLRLLGVPVVPLSLLAGLAVLTYLAVHHTWFGRAFFAMGDNERAAQFAGLPIDRLKWSTYAYAGLVAGVCGLALVLTYGAAKPDAQPSLELWAIACVILGGVRVTGGAGHVGSVLLGTLTVIALLAGLGSAVPDWRDTITGGLLIGVAVLNETIGRWVRVLEAHQAKA